MRGVRVCACVCVYTVRYQTFNNLKALEMGAFKIS